MLGLPQGQRDIARAHSLRGRRRRYEHLLRNNSPLIALCTSTICAAPHRSLRADPAGMPYAQCSAEQSSSPDTNPRAPCSGMAASIAGSDAVGSTGAASPLNEDEMSALSVG
ncbi:hypothetical protein A0H81_01257 [Grifola frondosa]|uniref:Uncharacterized protein n=1 Tax=Grifola frondosa TaxID=5627 RepID=A0A1C7MQ77_GRIFR|nr:hypothetical protein A0H81_01257 [Grifola frondosa]